MHILKYFIFFLFTIARRSFAFCISLLFLFTCLLTGSSVNQDALVGPQVAEVEQHHVGGDVVDGEGGRLLEAHALWDEEGVAHRRHHHLLPQPEAAQHHHLVADLPGEERRSLSRGEEQNHKRTQRSRFSFFFLSFFLVSPTASWKHSATLVQLRLGQFALEERRANTRSAGATPQPLGNRGDLGEGTNEGSQKPLSGSVLVDLHIRDFTHQKPRSLI